MSGILYFLVAILVFGLIIFVHEFGHFLAARAAGIRVLNSRWLRPKLVGWRRKETDYSLRLLPLAATASSRGRTNPPATPGRSPTPVWSAFSPSSRARR